MDHLLLFFYLEHDDDHLYVYLQMIHALVVVTPSSKFYKVYTVLFYKYVGANISVANCMLHFLCFTQPRPIWNCLMETWDMTNELGLFYVVFVTVPLHLWWEQFIIVRVTLPKTYHRGTSNFMLVFRRLHMNLLKIVIYFYSQGCPWRSPYQT